MDAEELLTQAFEDQNILFNTESKYRKADVILNLLSGINSHSTLVNEAEKVKNGESERKFESKAYILYFKRIFEYGTLNILEHRETIFSEFIHQLSQRGSSKIKGGIDALLNSILKERKTELFNLSVSRQLTGTQETEYRALIEKLDKKAKAAYREF